MNKPNINHIIIFVITVFVCNVPLIPQNMELFKTVDIYKEITKPDNLKHLQVFTSDKKKVGNYLSIDVNKILQSNLKDTDYNNFNNYIFILESADGKSKVLTGYDFKLIKGRIPPYLLVSKTGKSPFVPKTLKDTDVEGEVNLQPLENELFSKTALYLRIKENVNNLKDKIKENTIIFPDDLTSERIFSELRFIKIYRLVWDFIEKDGLNK